MGKFSFSKSERLSSRNSIQELFSKGSSFYLAPFKVLVLKGNEPHHQVLFSVSKRNFKKAVDRNLVKRRLREAYRLNKAALPQLPALRIVYIYTAKEIWDYHRIEEKIKATFKRLTDYAEKL
ncbi:MAG: ribonuclease P protein component [Cyclobacteriaceae bacterium]|nr:ribonuclease P protein component [Cyclobacteriaceae bacterium]